MAYLPGFQTDPWSSGSGDIGLGSTLTYADVVGPQTDGTYQIPVAAQQVNNPANSAGYSTPMSAQSAALLSQGIGVLGNLANSAMVLDYKKYEATNGGLFMQGRGINGINGMPQARPNYSMLLLLAGVVYFMQKG